jgi:phospholipid-translocating ATPase
MGTVSYGFESMDEVAHQLHVAFGSGEKGTFPLVFPALPTYSIFTAHKRQTSLMTGAQLATRGRRDMSSRVKDVVLSLALCHNVSVTPTWA